MVIDETAFRQLMAGEETILEAADHTAVRIALAIGWSEMFKAIAAAAGPGEFRELLNTIASAIDRHELHPPPIQTPRLRRPAT